MTTPSLPPDSDTHLRDLTDALAILLESTTRFTKLEAEVTEQYLDLADGSREEYEKLHSAIEKAGQAAKDIARMHPEWFAGDSKTVSTIYGSVQSRSVTKLEVPNPEVTIQLLRQLGPSSEPFLRITTELNMEAMEILSDEELERIRVTRVNSESLSIKLAKPKLGDGIKKAAKKAAKKAKATAAAEEPAAT